ncbi:unnamed protein product [Sympodiomycopsis kandeliae]
MDGVSLAHTKAQWDDALQGAVRSFRLLVSQSTSKTWKHVVPPTQPSQTYHNPGTSTPTGPSSRPINATPNGSLALREKQPGGGPRRASAVFSTSEESTISTKGKAQGSQPGLSSSPSLASLSAHPGPSNPPTSTFPSRNVPFLPDRIDASAVKLHRRSGGKQVGLPNGVDVHRAVVDVPFDGTPDLEAFKSALFTPEARKKWDSMVDHAETIEVLDPQTQVAKTNFRLGWPASPRDAITISRIIQDANTLIYVATSLPRSADAPAYLRPAPPYVRSHVHLFAWCIQFPDASNSQNTDENIMRMTTFHAWDLRGAWLGMPPGGLSTHLSSVTKGMIRFIRKGANTVPALRNWGPSVEVLSSTFDVTRDMLSTDYCITAEESAVKDQEDKTPKDAETQAVLRSRKALGNGAEVALPAEEGWDVKVTVKAQLTNEDDSAGWSVSAVRQRHGNWQSSQVTLRLHHARLEASDDSVRVHLTIQRIAASSDVRLRVNDEPHQVIDEEEPANTSANGHLPLLHEASSLSDISLHTIGTSETQENRHKPTDSTSQFSATKRNAVLGPLIRRNYIYFTSMLQEPDAKWKHLSDNRGVTVTQLDSIDPTLVVYRAEATFVNVGVWDIFASIASPGTRPYWDKNLEEAKLLEDVGNVSTLWHTKTKAAWPASPRDSVEIETSYKSPSSVHIFSFSTEDRNLFPSIPSPALGTIRTQVDLRGWSVESLSPTTVHVTLIEQSDPKGWTSKSATPAAMTAAVAGVGEHAIKMGAPPVLTRILDATVSDLKYDSEKATFRLEYSRSQVEQDEVSSGTDNHNVECELRCDLESWAANLDLVVDPPPINVSCLRRHKLSPGGGGLWITIEHVPASLEDDAARVTVRRGAVSSPSERGVVLVNGAKIKVDIDELKDTEVAQLKDRKRSKPQRVPLDMRQKARKDVGANQMQQSASASGEPSIPSTPLLGGDASIKSVPSRVGSPAPPDSTEATKMGTPFSDKQPKHAMTPALDVLFLLRRIYAERSPDPAVTPAGWALVSQRNGLYVRKKLMQSISPTIAVQRGDKVVQGVTAEDMLAAVSSIGCRRQWDERVENSKILQSYGDGTTTAFFTTTGAFPFRGRGFYLANLTSRAAPPSSCLEEPLSSPTSGVGAQSIYYHASASFPEQSCNFDPAQVNPAGLPIGRVLIDGWIFETLDPYSSTLNYQIPSTRCTHIVAVDYAGSLPAAVNSMWNTNLPRSILAIESYVKTQGAVPSVRAPPPFVQVLGDGRDEDHDYVWNLTDGVSKRRTSLLYSNFSATDRRLEIMLHVPKQQGPVSLSHLNHANPLASRFLRTPTVSNASTTKASAQAATSTMSLSRSTSLHDDLASSSGTGEFGDAPSSSAKSLSKSTKTPSALLAPGFQGSIRAPRASLRGSDVRPRGPVVLGDVEIELKHYAAGYKVEIYSEFVKAPAKGLHEKNVATSDEGKSPESGSASASKQLVPSATEFAALGTSPPLRPTSAAGKNGETTKLPVPLDTIAKSKKDIPVATTFYDLPPSAVLAATLDPSARPRRHLLRLALPEVAADIDDIDSSSEDHGNMTWRQRLADQDACIRVVVRPVKGDSTRRNSSDTAKGSGLATPSEQQSTVPDVDTDDIDSQQVPVHCGGQRMEVIHVNKTSSMLQREHANDSGLSVLQRLPRTVAQDNVAGSSNDNEDLIPRSLAHPIASAVLLEKKPEAAVSTTITNAAQQSGSSTDLPADGRAGRQTATTDTKEAMAAGHDTQGDSSHPTSGQKESPAPSAATSLMGLLQTYPLSRLGASTALTTVSAMGEGTRKKESEAAGGSGTKSSEGTSGAQEGASAATGQISSMLPDSPAVLFGGRALHEARFSLATLIVVALICFLAGSLLRAMLSPADFIFYPSRGGVAHALAGSSSSKEAASDVAGAAVSEIQRLLGAEQGEQVAWRKVLRLLEIKRAVAGRFDLVLAVVDRRL